MIEKQKNSFWRTLDGIDTFKVDASQIPLELVEQLPPELLVRNSKKEYFRLIIWTAGLYLVFIAVALLWKRPFIEAYEASPFWSVALALFPLALIGFYVAQYFNNSPRVILNKSGIKYKGEFVSWFSADNFELIHNSSKQTYSIVIKNKDSVTLAYLDADNLELSPDRLLIALKAFQIKCAKIKLPTTKWVRNGRLQLRQFRQLTQLPLAET
jgi:hypothetical protein